MYQILRKEKLNETVDLMVIKAPLVALNAEPGQFIILRVDEFGERIPLTIVETNDEDVTIIYQQLGYSTKLLGTLKVGDYVHDFVGPLGKATHIHDVSRVLAVAGGVGAAPMLPQLREYAKRGVKIDLVLGARSEEFLILKEEYKAICDNVYFITDDGSFGEKGLVTDIQRRLLELNKYDQGIAIGPLVMMKYVVLLNKAFNLKTEVSLNPVMIDGTGMCGNCRVSIGGKTFFACVDGPDFPGDDVDFDELMIRQNYYKDEEHVCNLEKVQK